MNEKYTYLFNKISNFTSYNKKEIIDFFNEFEFSEIIDKKSKNTFLHLFLIDRNIIDIDLNILKIIFKNKNFDLNILNNKDESALYFYLNNHQQYNNLKHEKLINLLEVLTINSSDKINLNYQNKKYNLFDLFIDRLEVYNYYYDKKTYRETYYGLNLLENLLKKDKLIIDYKSKSIVNNGVTPIFKLLYEFIYKLDSKISFNKFIFKHIEDNIDFSIKNKYGFNVLEEIISLSHRYNQKNSNKNLSTYINYIVNIAYKNDVSLNLSSDFTKIKNNYLIRDYLYKNDELNSKSLIYKYLLDIDKMDWNNINLNTNLLDYIPDFNLFSNDELKLIADNYKSYNIDLYILFKDNDLLNENLQNYMVFYKYLIESNLIDINHTLEDKKTNYFISPLHRILNDMIFKFSFDIDLLEKLIKNNPDFLKTNENGENIFLLLSESVNKDFNMEAFNQYEKIVKFFHEKNINLYLNNQNKKNKKSAISYIFNGDIFYKSESVYSKQNKGHYYKKTDNIFYLSIENSIGNIDIDFDLFLTNNVFNEDFAKLIFKRINDFNQTEDELFSFFKKNIDRTAFTPIITRKHLPTGTIKFEMRKKTDTILNYYQNLDSTFNILFNYRY